MTMAWLNCTLAKEKLWHNVAKATKLLRCNAYAVRRSQAMLKYKHQTRRMHSEKCWCTNFSRTKNGDRHMHEVQHRQIPNIGDGQILEILENIKNHWMSCYPSKDVCLMKYPQVMSQLVLLGRTEMCSLAQLWIPCYNRPKHQVAYTLLPAEHNL